MEQKCGLFFVSLFCTFAISFCTFGYYKIYTPYGTGDTILQTWTAHGGPINQPHRKWIIECMDGEAVTGILDNGDDYTRLWYVWCKFMFPYKPPAQGVYPYFPSCHIRNMTTQYFCYHAVEHAKTVNTFVVGFAGLQFNFAMNRQGTDDRQPYKCCKTPNGYFLDYTACYYQPTHDSLWEYYDSPAYFVVYCATGYVMTGVARKPNPFTKPDYHMDWIQCCRLGFGVLPRQQPPSNGSYSMSDYSNVTAYNYQRAKPNRGAFSRFANDVEREPGDETNAMSHAWPTGDQPIVMAGSLPGAGNGAASQNNENDVSNLNSGLFRNSQLNEFFSQSGGGSTLGPLTSYNSM